MKLIKWALLLVFLLPAISYSQNNVDLKVKTLNNREISLSSLYKKGPALVTFWALWCEPCREEMKHIKVLYKKYHEKGFEILSLNQDSQKSVAKVRAYISSQRIKFPVALDPNYQYMQKLNGQSIPYSLLFDTKGIIVYKQIGYLPGDEVKLEKEILKLLKEEE